MTNIMALPLARALWRHTQGDNYSHAHVHAHKPGVWVGFNMQIVIQKKSSVLMLFRIEHNIICIFYICIN